MSHDTDLLISIVELYKKKPISPNGDVKVVGRMTEYTHSIQKHCKLNTNIAVHHLLLFVEITAPQDHFSRSAQLISSEAGTFWTVL